MVIFRNGYVSLYKHSIARNGLYFAGIAILASRRLAIFNPLDFDLLPKEG